jgi:acetyl-CoA acetyltransferase
MGEPRLFDRAVIAGIGHTEFSKQSGRSTLQLAAEASRAAIADSGLAPADIDGMVTFTIDDNDELALMDNLGIPSLSWVSRTPFGGGGASAVIQHAVAAIGSGAASTVLVYRAFNERSERRFGQPEAASGVPGKVSYRPYGLDTPAKIYSLWWQRYMYEHGVTNEDFGRYSVVARTWAATNPNAWYYGRPITLADHQASRWIVEPILRLLDCCQESDGGVALVVTGAERAADLAQPAVRVAAAVQGHLRGGDIRFDFHHPDLGHYPEAGLVAQRLWDASGLKPSDIQVAMIYENFSPIVFLQLESLGFCGRGEAKDFIAEGHIGPGGSIPVNTNGGLLGEAYIHGINNIIEGVRQLRGSAANQIDRVDNVVVASGRSALILTRH